MEPPHTASLAPPPAPSAVPSKQNYSDSVESSPRSRNADSWDDTAASNKLRLLCSYGGHIVPRPHDKSLCYVGGDTRIVVADRQSSLADLSGRLSKTLLGGRAFTLKYQLPNEDLDSLISVTTDEDLDNMIDEYDRTATSPKPSRLRLFLFPDSIGPILDSSVKSEDWFLNALNGAGLLNRGFSESASVNSLLGLDDGATANNPNNTAARAVVEASQAVTLANGKNAKQGQGQGQDVHSVPGSPMLDTSSSSSFGSSASSPSLANLPPIRVHVEDGNGGMRVQDQRLGIEEQFAQISVSGGHKYDEALSPPSSMPRTLATAAAMSSGLVGGEYVNRVISDDERSEHGVPVGYGKPPTQQPQSLLPHRPNGGIDLAPPDSVSSDSSIANPLSGSKPVIYHEQLVQIPSVTSRVNANPVDPNTRVQMQQVVHDPGYVLQHQFDQQQQQQFIHPGAHYIQHQPGGVPVPAYYPVYPSQHHPQLDQQYPVYYMPARQGQAYNASMQQTNISGAPTGIPPSRPQASPAPAMAAYTAMRIAKPEGVYRTGAPPTLVQVPSSQHQQPYIGFSQMQYPSQSVGPTTSAPSSYAYEYAETARAPIYYTQPTMSAAQYQTMTGAAAAVLPDGSAQHPKDAIKQQQVRTSQAI